MRVLELVQKFNKDGLSRNDGLNHNASILHGI